MFQLFPPSGPGAGPVTGTVTGPGARPLADSQGPGAGLKADQKEFTIRMTKNKELHENLHSMLKVSGNTCYGNRDREPGPGAGPRAGP